jgi:hypothetical protein
MIHLLPNSATNTVNVTPFEARKFLSAFTYYLLELTNQATQEKHYAVPVLTYDNERYTQFDLPTNSDTLNAVLITESGLYTYKIWGQNSPTNLDPADASVVGICEVGPCRVSDEPAWTIPAVSIPDNVIYYE